MPKTASGFMAPMKARLHLGNGRYSVLFDGKLLVERSRDPECDAARALLARGYTGQLQMLDGKAMWETRMQVWSIILSSLQWEPLRPVQCRLGANRIADAY
jgi:hypothetical protein